MTEIWNLTINELSNVERPNLRQSLQEKIKIENIKRRNSFISKGRYENRQNYETKFADFWNFDSFQN